MIRFAFCNRIIIFGFADRDDPDGIFFSILALFCLSTDCCNMSLEEKYYKLLFCWTVSSLSFIHFLLQFLTLRRKREWWSAAVTNRKRAPCEEGEEEWTILFWINVFGENKLKQRRMGCKLFEKADASERYDNEIIDSFSSHHFKTKSLGWKNK